MPLRARIVRNSSRFVATTAAMLVVCAAALSALTGCSSGRPQSLGGSVVGEPIEVAPQHVHSASCGHFRRQNRWYYAPDHAHHSGCGHIFRDGVWVVEE